MRTIFWHNRWSGTMPHVFNRVKRSNLQKKRQKILGFGACWRKNFFTLSPSYNAKSPKPSTISFFLQFCSWDGSFRHGEMKIWVCLYFTACYEIHWNWFCGRKQTKNAKIRKGAFFREGCFDRKSRFQTQRINPVHGRCSSSGVLRDIPPNFTLRVRRLIVL